MRNRVRRIALALSCTGALVPACGYEVHAGYAGPYPSPAAQEALHELVGTPFPGAAIGSADRELAIADFVVSAESDAANGPAVYLRRIGTDDVSVPLAALRRFPVQTDGDAADLIRRITGSAPVRFGGGTSPAYRATLGPAAR